MQAPAAADIRNAAERIAPIARTTPVLTSTLFNQAAACEAFFKCENFQKGGAFKIRGAANFLYSMTEAERAQGVVAYSSGNHGQAVAIAAQSVNSKATLVMPVDAPKSKIESTRARGATVVAYNRFRDSREAIGDAIARETGATLVPPFDHPWIIAGQGTTALELLEQYPDLDALAICIGGGGLISGCALIAKEINPKIRIFGVEPELANDTYLSFHKGERVEIPQPDTAADGLRALRPGVLTFPIIQRHVEDILLVSETDILSTMAFLLTRLKIVVEPSGAVAAAAVLQRKLPAGCRRVGIVVSGGNVDLDILGKL